MDHMVYEQRIELPYVYTAGAAQRAALDGLRDARLVAAAGDGWVNAPAVPFGPRGEHLRELSEISAEGVLLAVTRAHHRPDSPTLGLIRIDGASNALLHRLGGGAEQLVPGARARAVWAQARSGSILDISHFEPLEQGASS
ncbi:MAG: hypothetical protein ACYCU0_04490 [Solirubrobacteraceae bacterium]